MLRLVVPSDARGRPCLCSWNAPCGSQRCIPRWKLVCLRPFFSLTWITMDSSCSRSSATRAIAVVAVETQSKGWQRSATAFGKTTSTLKLVAPPSSQPPGLSLHTMARAIVKAKERHTTRLSCNAAARHSPSKAVQQARLFELGVEACATHGKVWRAQCRMQALLGAKSSIASSRCESG